MAEQADVDVLQFIRGAGLAVTSATIAGLAGLPRRETLDAILRLEQQGRVARAEPRRCPVAAIRTATWLPAD